MMPDIVAHAHSPELGGLGRDIGLHSKTLPQKTKQKQWWKNNPLACSRECLLVLPYLRYKSAWPPFVNEVLLGHSYILWFVLSELGSCETDPVVCKAQTIYNFVLYGNFCWLLLLHLKMTIIHDCCLLYILHDFFLFKLGYLCLNVWDTFLLCFPLVTDVPQTNSKRSKENEGIMNEHIKKRKKPSKDYQPNYFLSVPIINKKVIVS